jgi:hypothetical protein
LGEFYALLQIGLGAFPPPAGGPNCPLSLSLNKSNQITEVTRARLASD